MSFIELFRNTRKNAIRVKMWIQRSMSWLALINVGMILFLVLSRLQDYGVKIYITQWFIPIFIGSILVAILFGYLEDKFGFYREEASAVEDKNPYNKKILEKLESIEKRLKKLEK